MRSELSVAHRTRAGHLSDCCVRIGIHVALAVLQWQRGRVADRDVQRAGDSGVRLRPADGRDWISGHERERARGRVLSGRWRVVVVRCGVDLLRVEEDRALLQDEQPVTGILLRRPLATVVLGRSRASLHRLYYR